MSATATYLWPWLMALLALPSCQLFMPAPPPSSDISHTRTSPREENVFSSGVKKKVALLTFFNESSRGGQDLGIIATEELRRELVRAPEFLIPPPAEQNWGTSKEIYAGGGGRLPRLAQRAKKLGYNFILYGRIVDVDMQELRDEIGLIRETKSYTHAKVEIRLYDIGTNKNVYTGILKGHADDRSVHLLGQNRGQKLGYRRQLLRYAVRVAIRRSIPKLVKIAQQVNWMGRVARIIGNKIYLNAGRKSGIKIGDIMRVVTDGEQVYDPETGSLIGISKGELKGTIEVVDYFGPDGSVAVLHSGGGVVEGDFVRLY